MNQPGSVLSWIVLWPLRLALSGAFIYAGIAKLREPQSFAESIASFRLLPPSLIGPAALTLPPLEILAGLLALLPGRARRAGAFCLLMLLAIFTLALASAQVRGLNVDCGCFGGSKLDVLAPGKNLWLGQVRDVGLAAVAACLYVSARSSELKDGPRANESDKAS